jgi:flagellar hook-associated protein 1
MGLSSTLSNALSGMHASQRGIDVVSRNVANAGTPGYHRQSQVLLDTYTGQSSQVRASGIDRAFDQALQKQHVFALSDSGYHNIRASYLERLQMHMGMPGDTQSLDKLYQNFENALQAMATTPDDLTTRAMVLNSAQALAEQLNKLSGAVQDMRRETEGQISNSVSDLNRQLASLADLNVRILDLSQDQTARLSLMDERDRLVSSIAHLVDVKVTYRDNGTVALMTDSGIGILDVEPSVFEFKPGGKLNAGGDVGELSIQTPSGLKLNMANDGILSSGMIAGLIELRDNTLVNAQDQLDEIAAGLALAMSTLPSGHGVSGSAAAGFALDLDGIQKGNSFALTYMEGGQQKTVRVVNAMPQVTSPTNVNAAGERVIHLDLSDVTGSANILDGLLLSLGIGEDSDGNLTVLGAGLRGLTTAFTAPDDLQSGQPALNLFVDTRNTNFTNALDGNPPQKAGFAGRIQINSELIGNSGLLVQYSDNISMGDATRPQFILDNLKSMTFVSDKSTSLKDGGVRLSGRVGELIGQTINHTGNVVARGQSLQESQQYTLDALTTRMDAAYGVNVDEEMARLMELQNAYAASARVVSTVQELIDSLLRM